jgi:solute:Na+ symporter, SSS family
MAQLTSIDYLVILSYLAATMVIGLWVGSYVRSGSDFFLAGRSLPWWAIGMSLVATDIGGTDLIGVGGDTYRYGIVMGNFEWIGCIPAMLVGAFVFIPHLWRCRVTTIPEFLERRFSIQLRSSVAACWLLLMACNLGVMLLASAVFLKSLSGWDISICILTTAMLVGVYTWSGGLAAVVYTDVLQGVVMICGCAVFVVVGIYEVGGIEPLVEKIHAVAKAQDQQELLQREQKMGATERTAEKAKSRHDRPTHESEHLSLVLPVDTRSPGPWPGILFGLGLIVGPGYWIGNQCIVQRALGAKSEYEAKASYVCGALIKNLIPFLVAVPGLIALVKFPQLGHERADVALPQLVGALLPAGFRGMFVAAFLAALMSSVDSYLNSATTLYVNDFYRRFYRPEADEGQILAVGRWTTVGFVVWGIYFAFQLQAFPAGIYTIFQTLLSFLLGPTLAVLVAGMLSRSASSDGAVTGFYAGLLTSIGLFSLNQPGICRWLDLRPLFNVGPPYLYYSIWSFLVAISFIVIFSYFLRSDPPGKTRYAIGGVKPEGGAT